MRLANETCFHSGGLLGVCQISNLFLPPWLAYTSSVLQKDAAVDDDRS